MNVVIYARYSCSGQREESIEGQLQVCQKYARENNLTIIKKYIDKAKTGRSDDRPQFQQMITDSGKREFEAVLVYSLDRFSRDMYKSMYYELKLQKSNVSLMSATENFANTASGRFYKNMMMCNSQFFTDELSQKVKRGLYVNAEKGLMNGGVIPFGYKLIDKKLVVDNTTAPYVERIFQMYADGKRCIDIIKYLNSHGMRTARGTAFNRNSLHTILNNRKYIGEYKYGDVIIKEGVPRIINDDLFNEVAEILVKNKHNAGHNKAKIEYLLTTKLFCGNCKSPMVGISGTSRHNKTYYYYSCNESRKKRCKKRNVRKELIEDLVVNKCREMLTDENINKITREIIKVGKKQKDNTNLKYLKNQIKQTQQQIENLITALSMCNIDNVRKDIFDKIAKLEAKHAEFEKELSVENLRHIELTETDIKFFLTRLKDGDINDIKYRKTLVNIFVNSVYLYDDRATIIFNVGNTKITVDDLLLNEIEKSFADFKDLYSNNFGVPITPNRFLPVWGYYYINRGFEHVAPNFAFACSLRKFGRTVRGTVR